MKTNEFDSRIKQGLEGLSPVFNEQDWNRLQAKMNAPAGSRFGKKRYLLLLLLLFAGLGVGLVAWSFSGSSAVEKPVIKTGILATETSNEQNRVGAGEDQLKENATTAQLETSAMDTQTEETANAQTLNPIAANRTYGSAKEMGTASPFIRAINAKQEHIIDASALEASILADPVEALGSSAIGERRAMLELDPLAGLRTSALTYNSPEDLSLRKLIKIQHGPAISRWSAGTMALLTRSHYSAGLSVQMAVNKNISFRSGLMRQKFFAQSFEDEQVFVEENDFEFTELAKPRHSKSTNFSNIKVNSADWVMPLELKYTHPLSFNSAVFLSGGIQLTLASKTALDFEYKSYDSQQAMAESDFEQASNNATLINNFVLVMGWQYNFRKIQCQLGMIFQNNNSNLPLLAKKEFGLMTGLSYRF